MLWRRMAVDRDNETRKRRAIPQRLWHSTIIDLDNRRPPHRLEHLLYSIESLAASSMGLTKNLNAQTHCRSN